MAKKKIRQKKNISSHSKKSHGLGLGVPAKEVKAFMALYSAKQLSEAQQAAQRMTESYPDSAFAWKALGTTLLEAGDVSAALAPLLRSYEFNAHDALTLTSLAAVYYRQGEAQQAIKHQMEAVALQPQYAPSQYRLAEMLQSSGQHVAALEYAKKSLELGYDELKSRLLLGSLQYQTKYFSEALENYLLLEKRFPENHSVHNNLGNLYKDMGEYKRAEEYYQKALANEPGFVMAYSNIFFSKHYDPSVTQEEIINFAKGWDERFSLSKLSPPVNFKGIDKSLRVGLISSGLRMHPVGQMITAALEYSRPDIDFYAYSTNDINDNFTKKISNVCKKWQQIRHLSQNAIAEQIRNDGIDILIDLSGHGDGSCLQAISMRPAPLCVKWVGGLVNTMGLESIDYLLSDSIETPESVDDQYTEKLIRLPDDYICYSPCEYAPNTTSLPALKNRYITLGCLNNAAKISAQLLGEWAVLMHQLPNSRLLLRGALYESQNYCQRIWDEMAQHGIEQDRILLEGPINHKEFIATYQRIDIALDTWPYSGGLTTCEALLMGVPVVTLPGPTFAGRHSATHLINAGLQELVTNSWDEYRQRVIELANDLPNLAVIRAGLRTILYYSPVCDAPRFANHFNNALRAIWVRYCEGKAPEALTFNKEGEMWFADEDMLVELPECSAGEISGVEAFEWKIDKPITIIDNAAVLPRNPAYAKWMSSGDLAVISFDPASLLTKKVEELKECGELHHYPHALLGDGQTITLYATLDAEKGSTLKPLPEDQQPEYLREKLKVLAKLPINTLALDSIEGLPSMDMLVLDDLHDAIKVIENGERSLREALLIQVRVAFQPSYERQPNLAELQHWMTRHGFRFYCFNNERHQGHFSQSGPQGQRQATELVSVDAIFLPSYKRMVELIEDQRIKLAFLLHTIFGIRDMSYQLLAGVDKEKAEEYLLSEGMVKAPVNEFDNVVTPKQELPIVNKAVAGNISQDIDVLLKSYTELQDDNTTREAASSNVAPQSPGFEKPNTKNKPTSLWELDEPISVVDVGANPIDGTPPYAEMLKQGLVTLVGFEPQKEALQKLQTMKGANETYLPHAVGTGEHAKLYICQASGMTSTLKPNSQVLNHFQGYPIWGKVKSVEEIETVRLDDIDQIEKIDWLKIDIQGGELNVFRNGEKKLKDTLVIQTEVNFIQLYENQPLFAEIDQWMRAHGFMLHTLLEQRKRLYAPMKINGGIHQGINQLTTADAVYVRDINSIDALSSSDIKKMAFILHEAYGSYDLSLRLLKCLNVNSYEKKYLQRIGKKLPLKVKEYNILKASSNDGIRHCFVFGCGHTGTTLMATILGHHESVYTIKRETGWFLGDGDIKKIAAPDISEALGVGKKWLCEKTPRHVYCLEKIKDTFPSARCIVMVRSAKDVVASIKNRTGNFKEALGRWVNDTNKSIEVSQCNDVVIVRYEDLIENPEDVVKKVCSFIGVEFSKEMLSYYEGNEVLFGVEPEETDGKGECAHLKRRAWQMRQPLQDRRGIWKEKLTDSQAAEVDEATREIMLKLGYKEL